MSVARRGFLAVVAGVCLWPVRSLLGRPTTGNGLQPPLYFCGNKLYRQPPTPEASQERAAAASELTEKLEPLFNAWHRGGLGPAVLVVPPDLADEVEPIVVAEREWSGGADLLIVVDPFCPPGTVHLSPMSSWAARCSWGRTNG